MSQTDASGRTILGRGKFLQLVRDGRWEIAERINCHGAVAIVAVTTDRRLVLTEQFRPAVKHRVIDLAAGLSGDEPGQQGEPFLRSAKRELLEETGFAGGTWTALGHCPSSPGLTSEVLSYFYADGVAQKTKGGGVAHEAIVVHTPSLRTIKRWLAARVAEGVLIDPKVYAGLYFVKTWK